MTHPIERGAPIPDERLRQQGWAPVRCKQHADGDVRATLGPFKPGHARTLTELLAATMRHQGADGHPLTACLVREAVARPVSGLPRGFQREMLTLQLDADDADAAVVALGTAARSLVKQLAPFAVASDGVIADPRPVYQTEGTPIDLDDLELRPRTRQSLSAAGLRTVDELLTWTPAALLRLPLLGRRGLEEIQVALAIHGLCLASDPPRFRP